MPGVSISIVITICCFIIITYAYIFLRQREIDKLREDIDSLFREKFSQITLMINVVKQTYSSDGEVLKNLTLCLNAYIKSRTLEETAAANAKMDFTLSQLAMILKSYPLIKNSIVYVEIDERLILLEEKLGFAAQFYNEAIANYNLMLRKLPFKIIAGIFNIKIKKQI